MLIEQAFVLDAPREAVAELLTDIDRVSGCIPGIEDVTETAPGSYDAVLAVRLGPIRAAFKGHLDLDDSQAPDRLVAAGEGRDRATGSLAKVRFTADLTEPTPGRTTVAAVADVALRGRLGQFGTGVMRAAAAEIVAEFAEQADRELAAEGGAASAPPAAPREQRRPGLLRLVARGMLTSLRTRLRGLFSRGAGRGHTVRGAGEPR